MNMNINSLYTWRCPMKEEGADETKRLSVKMPVSTLLNSRRVWSPAIWPEVGEGRERRRSRGMKRWKRRKDTALMTLTQQQPTFTLCHADGVNNIKKFFKKQIMIYNIQGSLFCQCTGMFHLETITTGNSNTVSPLWLNPKMVSVKQNIIPHPSKKRGKMIRSCTS